MTTKKTTTTTTKKPSAAEAADKRAAEEAQAERAAAELQDLMLSVTQREWLQITGKLDRTREQIGDDSGLSLLAAAWLKNVRAHGGANWDRLLDMTDAELITELGFPAGTQLDE